MNSKIMVCVNPDCGDFGEHIATEAAKNGENVCPKCGIMALDIQKIVREYKAETVNGSVKAQKTPFTMVEAAENIRTALQEKLGIDPKTVSFHQGWRNSLDGSFVMSYGVESADANLVWAYPDGNVIFSKPPTANKSIEPVPAYPKADGSRMDIYMDEAKRIRVATASHLNIPEPTEIGGSSVFEMETTNKAYIEGNAESVATFDYDMLQGVMSYIRRALPSVFKKEDLYMKVYLKTDYPIAFEVLDAFKNPIFQADIAPVLARFD